MTFPIWRPPGVFVESITAPFASKSLTVVPCNGVFPKHSRTCPSNSTFLVPCAQAKVEIWFSKTSNITMILWYIMIKVCNLS